MLVIHGNLDRLHRGPYPESRTSSPRDQVQVHAGLIVVNDRVTSCPRAFPVDSDAGIEMDRAIRQHHGRAAWNQVGAGQVVVAHQLPPLPAVVQSVGERGRVEASSWRAGGDFVGDVEDDSSVRDRPRVPPERAAERRVQLLAC
jgi:hypothetical protein